MNTTTEQERAAYMAGDTATADLLARIAELEHQAARYESALEAIAHAGKHGLMTAKQCAGAAAEVL